MTLDNLIKELRATTPRDSGYAETANAAADAIESLRALAATPLEPVAWRRRRKGICGDGGWIMCPEYPGRDPEFDLQSLYTSTPNREPVAWRWRTRRHDNSAPWRIADKFSPSLMEKCIEMQPLYAAPAPLAISREPTPNEETADHPYFDNPRDPFASPDRLPLAAQPQQADAWMRERESFDRNAVREAALEEAAKIAEIGCLVPPDGGSPTEEEREMCESIASAIRVRKLFPRDGAAVSRADHRAPAVEVSAKEAEFSTLKEGERSALTKEGIATIDRAYRWPSK